MKSFEARDDKERLRRELRELRTQRKVCYVSGQPYLVPLMVRNALRDLKEE